MESTSGSNYYIFTSLLAFKDLNENILLNKLKLEIEIYISDLYLPSPLSLKPIFGALDL